MTLTRNDCAWCQCGIKTDEACARAPRFKLAGWDNIVLAITSMAVAEIEYGLHRLPDGKRKVQLYVHFEACLSVLQVLPFDEDAECLAVLF